MINLLNRSLQVDRMAWKISSLLTINVSIRYYTRGLVQKQRKQPRYVILCIAPLNHADYRQMLLRTAYQTVSYLPSATARRGFHSSRVTLSSPYHYHEGPRTNIPFNPLTRFFYLRYVGFCATGFGLPFLIACEWKSKRLDLGWKVLC